MADSLMCQIVTPVKTVFEREATSVVLPGEAGSFGVMRRHEPLVSALVAGTVSVTVPDAGKDGKTEFVITGGYAQICDDKVIVLANDALALAQIDVEAAKAGLAEAERNIANLKEGDASAEYYKSQKAWFELQLHAVSAE